MMNQKLKVGPQTATDYKRSIIPEFAVHGSQKSVRVKDSQYFSGLSKNLWDDYGKLIEKNKTFLSKERNEQIEKHAKDLEQQDRKEREQLKQSKIIINKQECQQRMSKKLLEIALLQQQSHQIVDERQSNILLNNPLSPFEINKSKVKSQGRQYLNGQAENKWNDLTQQCSKSQKIIFTPKVIQFENQAIENIKKKLESIDENKEMIKSCYVQQGEILRSTFKEKHQKNLEFEKDLRIGIFGKNGYDKTKTKIIRIAQTPATYNGAFPTKYKMDPYIQKLKEKPLSEKDKQLCEKLATPKKEYQPQNVFDYPEFKGMLIPTIDKLMCSKQENIVKKFKENPSVKELTKNINSPERVNQLIIRPKTANSQRGFIMEPLSSFDDIQIQRSKNFIEHNQTEKEIVQELDKFSSNLKNQALQRPQSGFCRVTQKENKLLKDVEGFKKVREYKKDPVYPHNVIKGLDHSL
ncbi:hypothetical protein TTHERM_00194670 (macronuclear) [Tetrahymena thermophila SB210]|uniref:Uncharacterized protein n=1 Tax=Tetrahymena thermophila (strain SB210) TaxID=312017 RepID=Q23K68_TETTS|nr:hypothetical protein TTHERM_00194670 [Tetrahymena thermophila SB210]EAR96975.2 hypothetical protein TTHERM_00194670 [Tetrahymena thermophila SB210]|eukprot:XP_001017220.2 hypothetical protein TTHERM_00194670 [Tetrahymena thermophila SB210]